MNILIVSAQAMPVQPEMRYQGIERLAYIFATELNKLGHKVAIVATEGSTIPSGIEYIPTKQGGAQTEIDSFPVYKDRLAEFDVIHDFSHYHCPAMSNQKLPVLNVFWHDPQIAKYPEPQYNMVSISQWGADRFKEIYQQEARHQETVVVDPNQYTFSAQRNGRFLTLGKMSVEKGNLEAIRLCRKLGVGLDIVGGRIPPDPADYEDTVKSLCDGEQFRFYGDCSDRDKIALMQSAKALIYCVAQTEVHSHKSCEALMTGCSVITYDLGAMKEIVGSWGAVVDTENDFLLAMQRKPPAPIGCREYAISRWETNRVVSNYIKLYKEVAEGKRW